MFTAPYEAVGVQETDGGRFLFRRDNAKVLLGVREPYIFHYQYLISMFCQLSAIHMQHHLALIHCWTPEILFVGPKIHVWHLIYILKAPN